MLIPVVPSLSSHRKGLYDPKTFFTHAALLGQAFAHCPKFLAAASRRSLGRISVPVWLIILSDQLPIIALVSLYPTNKLIGHRPTQSRKALRSPAFPSRAYAVLIRLSPGYPPRHGHVPMHYSPVRRSPPGCPALPLDLHV